MRVATFASIKTLALMTAAVWGLVFMSLYLASNIRMICDVDAMYMSVGILKIHGDFACTALMADVSKEWLTQAFAA